MKMISFTYILRIHWTRTLFFLVNCLFKNIVIQTSACLAITRILSLFTIPGMIYIQFPVMN